jgi:hypothetical protein
MFRQWCSYTEQYFQGNSYFFDTIRACIDNGSHDGFVQCLKETFQLQDTKIDSPAYFCAFVLLHIYLYAQVADSADIVLDVDRAIVDPNYRSVVEQEIRSQTGLPVELSGAKARIAFSFLNSANKLELRDNVRVLADVAMSKAPSAAGRQFAAKALSDLFEEWDRYDFYAGVLSSACGPTGLTGKHESLTRERDAMEVARNAAIQERNAVAGERDRFRTERDALTIARDTSLEECNGLRAECDVIRSERDSLGLSLAAVVEERNGAAAECDALRVAQNAVLEERKAVMAERDALRGERDALMMARNATTEERNGVVAERDLLKAERDAMLVAEHGAAEERKGIVVERDALRAERDELTVMRVSAVAERDAVAAHRDALQVERSALVIARDTALNERDAVLSERDALLAERVLLMAERDALTADRDGLRAKSAPGSVAMILGRFRRSGAS